MPILHRLILYRKGGFMDLAERQAAEHAEALAEARNICLKAKIFSQCEACYQLTNRKKGLDAALELGEKLYAKRDPDLMYHFDSISTLMESINTVYEKTPERCLCNNEH